MIVAKEKAQIPSIVALSRRPHGSNLADQVHEFAAVALRIVADRVGRGLLDHRQAGVTSVL